jgi:hypothetical protein
MPNIPVNSCLQMKYGFAFTNGLPSFNKMSKLPALSQKSGAWVHLS